MAVHRVVRGLDQPIEGGPEQSIDRGPELDRVAVVAADYPYMRPRMFVEEGAQVRRGQVLFEDRKTEGVRFTAPAAGTVEAVHRGERRVLQSVVIRLSPAEQRGAPPDDEHQPFESWAAARAGTVASSIRDLLAESGLMTAIRQRPFGKIPPPNSVAEALFVTAMDTRPFAPDPDIVIQGHQAQFQRGVEALSRLTEGPTYVCVRAGSSITASGDRVRVEAFEGPHPAGLAGTHIHMLRPAGREHTVWHIDYQDAIAFGHLLETGRLHVDRVVSVAGPPVKRPRLLRTRLGAPTGALTRGELPDGDVRIISGSVLCGRVASGGVHGYVGRYDSIVSCLAEDRERVFFGWLRPGGDYHSVSRAFTSALTPSKRFSMTTNGRGSHRAMVPIGMYERVMPLDILPTYLLRALLSDDLERGEQLGALELIEEDLSLCSYVSPGKEDYGAVLRRNLDVIWKEG